MKSIRHSFSALLACFLFLGLSRPGLAYITSADLEYTVDDVARFWINGHEFAPTTGNSFVYSVLSIADGTLPLDAFNFNGDNLLAVENLDTGGGGMFISYRLTVHHSAGDPVVVWSSPDSAKMLHFSVQQPDPPGWYLPGYDDSAWGHPKPVQDVMGGAIFATLDDRAFGGMLGLMGQVPVLCHQPSGMVTNPKDHNLFRSHFRFPYSPSKTRILANPGSASLGGGIAFRVVPGADSSDLGDFKVYAKVPKGLEPFQISTGGIWQAASRTLAWPFPKGAGQVMYLKLPLSSVVNASTWSHPERALGYQISGPNGVTPTADFMPGGSAWFGVQAPSPQASQTHPQILGVIFHSKLSIGVSDVSHLAKLDKIYFNYSVGSSDRKALAQDVKISRTGNGGTWFDGYQDLTEDRHWTWADLSSLRVLLYSETRNKPQKSSLAGADVVVKCFNPNNLSPSFVAKVADAGCRTLKVEAGLSNPRFSSPAPDLVEIPVNPGGCATPTPVPVVVVVAGATPAPTPVPVRPRTLGLGCLQSSPEPFKRGGVFVYFCLKAPAEITLNVYNTSGGLLRSLPVGEFRAGNNQVFYSGADSGGGLLRPGSYVYEIKATATGAEAEASHSNFTKVMESAE